MMDIVIFKTTAIENEKLRVFLEKELQLRPSFTAPLMHPIESNLRSVIFEIQEGKYTRMLAKSEKMAILRRQEAINHA